MHSMDGLGPEGRRFESCLPDQERQISAILDTVASLEGGNQAHSANRSGSRSPEIVPKRETWEEAEARVSQDPVWMAWVEECHRKAHPPKAPRQQKRYEPRPALPLHRQADESGDRALCYFIGGESGLIKIGFAQDPRRRLRDFQPGSPVVLKILATCKGGCTRERAYHEQFAASRAHGEWFERTPALLAEIARLQPRPRPTPEAAS